MEHMLTTVDNPFSPVTQFDEWWDWDRAAGYDCLGFLARIVVTSDDLSESQQSEAIETAIDEIVRENVSGVFKKVPITGEVRSTT